MKTPTLWRRFLVLTQVIRILIIHRFMKKTYFLSFNLYVALIIYQTLLNVTKNVENFFSLLIFSPNVLHGSLSKSYK